MGLFWEGTLIEYHAIVLRSRKGFEKEHEIEEPKMLEGLSVFQSSGKGSTP